MDKRYYYITPQDYEEAAKNGIPAKLLEQRVRSYLWDVDRAITTPKKKQRCFKKTWGKWKELAMKNGVNRELFTNRVRSLGWNEEEAATTPKGCRISKRWTEDELRIAKENGIEGESMKLPYTRMRLGWSREDAVGTPRMTTEQRIERVKAGVKNRRVNREFNRKNRAMGN